MNHVMRYTSKFWLIWDGTPQGPKKQHWSEASAIEEAQRLAQKHPGKDFVVLESTRSFKSPLPTVVEARHV